MGSVRVSVDYYDPCPHWGICSLRNMSLILLGHMLSKDYVSNPVCAYVFQVLCPSALCVTTPLRKYHFNIYIYNHGKLKCQDIQPICEGKCG